MRQELVEVGNDGPCVVAVGGLSCGGVGWVRVGIALAVAVVGQDVDVVLAFGMVEVAGVLVEEGVDCACPGGAWED